MQPITIDLKFHYNESNRVYDAHGYRVNGRYAATAKVIRNGNTSYFFVNEPGHLTKADVLNKLFELIQTDINQTEIALNISSFDEAEQDKLDLERERIDNSL